MNQQFRIRGISTFGVLLLMCFGMLTCLDWNWTKCSFCILPSRSACTEVDSCWFHQNAGAFS